MSGDVVQQLRDDATTTGHEQLAIRTGIPGEVASPGPWIRIPNVAPQPHRQFVADVTVMARVLGGLPGRHDVVATMHTHPDGVCAPSQADERMFAMWPNATHTIVAATTGATTTWRVTAGGAVEAVA